LKVIQVPFCFYPDAVGGTEVYVASLARLLRDEHGCEVLIAAPGAQSYGYKHEDLRVGRFAVSPEVGDVSELYGDGDELAAREFEKILDEEQPDVVHLHAFTRGVSLKVLRKAKARGVAIVFTYHTSTVTCTRGTMMKWGSVPSDGVMLGRRCTACTLHGLGVNRVAAEITASIPRPIRNLLAKTRKSGGVWTALRMRELVEKRHDATRAFLAEVDHIVAVCEWVRDALVRNSVPENKITLCRQGIDQKSEVRGQRSEITELERAKSTNLPTERFSNERPLRLVYLGRFDPTKGVHVLIEALRLDISLPVTLDIYGVQQGESGTAYAARLTKLAGAEPRVRFCSAVPAHQVVGTLSQYDMLAVPSQWLETGPLVVLEAFAAGVPVLGSNLGGIAELVDDGVNGLLIRSFRTKDWYSALERIVGNPKLLADWGKNLGTPRTMDQVAVEMAKLYRQFIKREEAISHA
jgi:glycosyltransferase involved in cell wall biosynthesis